MKGLEKFANKRICVATSGGADSTALLHFLKSREAEYGYYLSAVHCEHGIRGEESVADMGFVAALCEKWGVPLFIFREDCLKKAEREKCSVETAAREFRRACFSSLVTENKADIIATAHHADDEAETVLFRIARGAALSGATGMKAEEGRYLRPFLTRSKADILAYIKENDLDYREDKTNGQAEYTRNKLRLEVFPALEEAVPGAKENFARFAFLAAEDEAYLQKQSEKLLTRKGKGRLVAFSEEAVLFRRAALAAMKVLGCDRDYTAGHLESAFALQSLERGARISLPKGVEAEKTKDGVYFYKTDETEPLPSVEKRCVPFHKMAFDGGMYLMNVCFSPAESTGEWKTLRVDADKIPENAVFRFREEGDKMRVFGGGTKSLKKLLNERKIPVKERAYLPVLALENEVLAVGGVEIADRVKVTEQTERIVYLILEKK